LAAAGLPFTTALVKVIAAAFVLFVSVTVCAGLVFGMSTVPKSRLVGDMANVGTSVSFATNASDVPFRAVCNAGVVAVAGGKIWKLLAAEKV